MPSDVTSADAVPPEITLGERVRQLRAAVASPRRISRGSAAPRSTSARSSAARRGRPPDARLAGGAPRRRPGVSRDGAHGGASGCARRAWSSAAEAAIESQTLRARQSPSSRPRRAIDPEIRLRALLAESWARMYLGDSAELALLGAGPRARRGSRVSPISTGRRSCTGSAAAATSCHRSRRRLACSAKPLHWRSAPDFPATG